MVLDRPVATAGRAGEALSIDDLYRAAAIGDQALLLKNAGHGIDGGALDAEQTRETFLGKREPVASGAVLGVEQPAGGACLDGVKGIARH